MKTTALSLRCLFTYAVLSRLGFQRGIFLLLLLERGFSGKEIGVLEASLFWANVLSELPSGLFGDRFGRKLSLVVGLILLGVNGIGIVLCDGRCFSVFLCLFMLEGIGLAFISGSDSALLWDLLAQQGREGDFIRIAARVRIAVSIAMGVAIALGGVLRQISWDAVYACFAIAMFLAVLVLVPLHEPNLHRIKTTETKSDGVTRTLWVFFRHGEGRSLMGLIVSAALFGAVFTPYFVYSPALLRDYGVGTTAIGIINALVELTSIPALFIAQRFVGAFRLERTVYISLSVSTGLLLMNLVPLLPVALVTYLLVMVAPVMMELMIENLLHGCVPSAIRASALSLMTFLESLFVGLVYITFGFALDYVPARLALAAGAIMPFAALLLARRYFAQRREVSASATLRPGIRTDEVVHAKL